MTVRKDPAVRKLTSPDEVIELPLMSEALVEISEYTVGRATFEPGWRWSSHVGPELGARWCESHHVGIVLSGRLGIEMEDGTTVEIGPDHVFDIPPGHDSFTVGDEPLVMLEWAGFALRTRAFRGRILCTLLFTDIVGSTETASQIGDAAWKDLLARHHHALRTHVESFRGRQIDTSGDGSLAIFDGPAVALRCATALVAATKHQGLQVRIGVHVGEVETVGDNVRGLAVHEAARVMSAAGPGEVLVTDTTRLLCQGSALTFEDRGPQTLKGLDAPLHLYRLVTA